MRYHYEVSPVIRRYHQWDYLISKGTNTISFFSVDVRKRNHHPLLVRISTSYILLESNLDNSFKNWQLSFHITQKIPLSVIYPKTQKTLVIKDICTSMNIATLFTVVKIWRQPKLSKNRWLTKETLVHIYIMEYYSLWDKILAKYII